MTTKIYQTKVQVDTPTPRKGVIYSRKILGEAICAYLSGDMRIGMLEDVGEENSMELDLNRISHNVKNVFIDDDGFMNVELAFLDTEQGRIAQLMPDMLEISSVMIGFCGWEGDSNVVEEAAVIHLNLAWKREGQPLLKAPETLPPPA